MSEPAPRYDRIYRLLRGVGWLGMAAFAVAVATIWISMGALGDVGDGGYRFASALVTGSTVVWLASTALGSLATLIVLGLVWLGGDAWARAFSARRLSVLVLLYGAGVALVAWVIWFVYYPALAA